MLTFLALVKTISYNYFSKFLFKLEVNVVVLITASLVATTELHCSTKPDAAWDAYSFRAIASGQ
jgi:hypothetical protein